jgi:hypothetical protein
MNSRKAARWLLAAFVAVGCRAPASPGREPAPLGAALAQKAAAEDRYAATAFEAIRAQYGDLTYEELVTRLGLRRAPESGPRFDPTSVHYYDKVRTSLQMTQQEEAIYRRTGLVSVDHVQRYSMGGLYHAIYTRDLPVLVTTDSILHAMHRSFDTILMQLELAEFAPRIASILRLAHDALQTEIAAPHDATLNASLADVDLYITVARNLLLGSGPEPTVHSQVGDDAAVRTVLQKVEAAEPDEKFPLYGGQRHVDWSEFVPLGHYTKERELG